MGEKYAINDIGLFFRLFIQNIYQGIFDSMILALA